MAKRIDSDYFTDEQRDNMTPLEKEIWEKAGKLDGLERDYLRITDQSKRPSNADELLE